MNSDLHIKIDYALKKIWKENIIDDYHDDFLLKEDTLKNAVYYHLRNELGDGFFKYHRLRIFTEYELGINKEGKRQRGDIVIVKLKPKSMMDDSYELNKRIEDIVTIIELKYKIVGEDIVRKDVFKMRDYIKSNKFANCQFYLGFIFERVYPLNNGAWLLKNQSNNWAKNRLTELTAHYDSNDDKFKANIFSYTDMNLSMNT